MGHAIHMSDVELKKLAKTKTIIAHCPTSNAPIRQKGLGSGLFDFKRTEKHKVRWALASDIGGGPILSMFDVMRSFVDQNKGVNPEATYTKALFRSTVAGAEAMGVSKVSGNFKKGKEASFITVNAPKGTLSDAEEVLGKVVNRGRRKRISYDQLPNKVFFKGKCLFEKQ